ncbi:MAG: hypothetical protein IRZ16_20020 [Myxococcaceae bacterium]|nr:hypothetical protein [Myxococcaceae bacterium]
MSAGDPGYLRFLPEQYTRTRPGAPPSFLERYLRVPEALLGHRDGTAHLVPHGFGALLDILPSLLSPRLSFLFPGSSAPLPPVLATGRDGTPNERETRRHLRTFNQYLNVVPQEVAAKENGGWEAEVLAFLSGFLDWMAGWLAFVTGAGWSVDRQRSVLAGLMPLYRQRGTRAGLEGMLRLFFGDLVQVVDLVEAPALRLGENTWLTDRYVEGGPVLGGVRPFAFAVDICVPTYDFESPDMIALSDAVRALVDAEKPLHARYVLRHRTVTIAVGVHSTVAVDTLIPLPEGSVAAELQ